MNFFNIPQKVAKKLKADAIPTENLPFHSSSNKENKENIDQNNKRSDRLERRHQRLEVEVLLKSSVFEEENLLESIDPGEGYEHEEHLQLEPSMPDETAVELKKTILDLQEKIDSLQNEKMVQDSKIMNLTQENNKLKEECSATDSFFTPTQKKRLGKRNARIKWSVDDISKCIAIHASGPRAYRFLLQKGFPFPAVITLKKWASKIDVNPGFLNTVFNLMRNVNLSQRDRVCMLMADEMKIRSCYEYDKKADSLLGPSNYVQVIMARGIFSNWKQPLYYKYDKKLTVSLMNAVMGNLDSIGHQVVAITMDLGGGNRGLLKEYGVNENKPYIQHPTQPNQKVFFFADVPHMVKLFRNHFLDEGIFIDNKHLTQAPLVEILENDSSDLKIAHRLTSEHLNVKRSKRQKVKYATQLFSHTNSFALNRMGMLGILKSSLLARASRSNTDC